jgi:tRNA(fMet)-specific endonuclease VapC
MKYLLDTNICIYTINYKPSSIIKQITSKQPDDVAISSITIAELEYGVSHSKYPDTNRIALLEFLIPFQIIDFDQRAAISYGLIRNELEANGKLIGPMDLLLAAQALSRDLVLVTNNEREFNRIKNLKIENWYKL